MTASVTASHPSFLLLSGCKTSCAPSTPPNTTSVQCISLFKYSVLLLLYLFCYIVVFVLFSFLLLFVRVICCNPANFPIVGLIKDYLILQLSATIYLIIKNCTVVGSSTARSFSLYLYTCVSCTSDNKT